MQHRNSVTYLLRGKTGKPWGSKQRNKRDKIVGKREKLQKGTSIHAFGLRKKPAAFFPLNFEALPIKCFFIGKGIGGESIQNRTITWPKWSEASVFFVIDGE